MICLPRKYLLFVIACVLLAGALLLASTSHGTNPAAINFSGPTTLPTDQWKKDGGVSDEGLFLDARALPLRQRPADQRRPDSYPLISGDTYRSVCQWTFDETGHNNWAPSSVKSGDLIFVKTDMLGPFFESRHRLIANPYVLISHNSDHPSPGPHLTRLNDTNLFAWYGQNGDCSHPKFHPLPIGFPNQEWAHGNVTTLLKQASGLKPLSKRRWLLYINVGTESNANRRATIDYFKSWEHEEVKFAENESHEQYLEDMKNSRFVLSPPGNGIDCHRTWEAVLMGAVPVVLPSFSFGELAQSVSVFVVENFQNLTSSHLLSYKCPQVNVSGLFANYWFKILDFESQHAKAFARINEFKSL